MFKKLIISVFAVLLLSMSVSFVFAADATKIGLAISPSLREAKVSPGDKYSDIIKVTNTTESVLNVGVSVQDFIAKGEEGDKEYLENSENSTYSMAKWVDIEKKFSLEPNETKEINYTIAAPANAEPGGHYAVILFSPQLEKASSVSGSGAVIESKIGPTLLITVTGDITYGAKIVDFSTNNKFYKESSNDIVFSTKFQSLSSNHVKPQGNIVIKNLLGNTVSSLVVNENQSNVLPDSTRKFTNTWQKKSGFGLYKASVNLNYGDGKNVSNEMTFWIIPWKETLAVIVILIIVIWLVSRLQWKK